MPERPPTGPPPGWRYEPTTERPAPDVAACAALEPDVADRMLYPSVVGDNSDARWDAGRRLCQGCPAQTACLNYALTRGEVHGMWGGVTDDERVELRRRLRLRAVRYTGEQLSPCGTPAAYQRHRRRGEEACRACKDAHAARTHRVIPSGKRGRRVAAADDVFAARRSA